MPSLPTFVSVEKGYCISGSNDPGQIANWAVHGSASTDSKNFVFPGAVGTVGTVSGQGTRLLKVHNDGNSTGAVDTWWFLLSFKGASMSEWNGIHNKASDGLSPGGAIYNWHNVAGDIGNPENAGDNSAGVSAMTIDYQSNTSSAVALGANYNGGGTLTLASNAAALGYRANNAGGGLSYAYCGSPTGSRESFNFTGVSGSTLTGVTNLTAGVWTTSNCTVNHGESGLFLHLEYADSGSCLWPLPNPVDGEWYDMVMKVVFGRTNANTVASARTTNDGGEVTIYVNGNDTASVEVTGLDMLQYKNPWSVAGRAYTQQYVQLWEGGPYVRDAAPRSNKQGPWRYTLAATRVGTTVDEAIADVPVTKTTGTTFWEDVHTSSGANPTIYGQLCHYITGAGYPNLGPCTFNEVWLPDLGTATPVAPTDANGGNIVKRTTDQFQLPPRFGGGGGNDTHQPNNSFGKWIAGANTGTLTADFKRVSKYTADANRLIASAYVWLRGGGSGTQTIKAVIYSNNAGEPGVLLGSSAEVTYQGTSTVGGFQQFTFSPTVAVLSGSSYWLGVISGTTTGVASISWDTVTDAGLVAATAFRAISDTYSDGATTSFGTATGIDTRSMAIYVVGAVGVSSTLGPAPVAATAATTAALKVAGAALGTATVVAEAVVAGSLTVTPAVPTAIKATWVSNPDWGTVSRGISREVLADGTLGAEVQWNENTDLWEYVPGP